MSDDLTDRVLGPLAERGGPAAPGARFRYIPIIVNPAAGQDRPILHALNAAFRAAGARWDLFVTHAPGDAERLARRLRAERAEVVAVYGGDGTLKEAARALAGTEIPLGILPGGTGNALSIDLGLPRDVGRAAALLCGTTPSRIAPIDMGQIGDHLFILRASMGLETELLRSTGRQLKEQLGPLAYPLTALQHIATLPAVRYTLTVDGARHEAVGVQCTLANAAALGLGTLSLLPGLSLTDGQLDAVVLTRAHLSTLAEIAMSSLVRESLGAEVQHWRGREITVDADPPQAVALGGDVIGQTPVTAHAVPAALRVIVPA